MNGHEHPPIGHEGNSNEHEQGSYSREYFSAAVDVIDKIGDLAMALRNDRMADRSQYTFMFDGPKLDKALLPEVVQDIQEYYGKLDELTMQIEYDEDATVSSFSLMLHFIGEEAENTLLKIERPGRYEIAPFNLRDHLYELGDTSRYRELSAIPDTEIRYLVASLIFPPSKTGDMSALDSLNLNDGTIYEPLVSALQKHSTHFFGQEYYDLSTTDHRYPGILTYTIDNGELISAEIYQTQQIDVMSDENTLTTMSKSILTEIDLSDGVTVSFAYATERGQDMQRDSFAPELHDYNDLIAFANHHITQSNPHQTERLTEIKLPNVDPPEVQ